MSATVRFRIFLGAVLAMIVCMLGATPALRHMPFPLTDTWPIAGFLLALSSARLKMSITAAVMIVLVGLVHDFVLEAPLGAWAFACLCAYGGALIAKETVRTVSGTMPLELVSVIVGGVTGLVALSIAGDISGGAQVMDASLWGDLILTWGLYYLVSPMFAPYDEALTS